MNAEQACELLESGDRELFTPEEWQGLQEQVRASSTVRRAFAKQMLLEQALWQTLSSSQATHEEEARHVPRADPASGVIQLPAALLDAKNQATALLQVPHSTASVKTVSRKSSGSLSKWAAAVLVFLLGMAATAGLVKYLWQSNPEPAIPGAPPQPQGAAADQTDSTPELPPADSAPPSASSEELPSELPPDITDEEMSPSDTVPPGFELGTPELP